ncbi:hypothetical protein [Cognatishimia sp. MH4019]|uniref:hypothetical protein n=1 Tax=Cognatishimia sp. MH4019 TaxID=2854030 RepID=UPI001CD4D3ED|nr:hypothetical protein [Cognatishimia sp. MH4019]
MRYLSIILCMGLLACGPALEDLPNINDVEVDPETASVEAVSTEEPLSEGGLLSTIMEPEAEGESAVATAPTTAQGPFGFLRRLRGGPSDPEMAEAPTDETVQTVEATPANPEDTEIAAVEPAAEAAPGRGLGGLFRAALPQTPNAAPDAAAADAIPEVPRGTLLPYGTLARVCGLRGADLGTEVARYPERGRGYRLYDTNPSSTGLRTHFVTGFKDNCARQFTAALAIFGETETHEAVRYDRSNRDLAFTETDTAYEKLKSRVCRVGRETPCSDRRRAALDKNTVFVSVYERFLGNPRWADMLLHDGQVLAKDLKER